MGAVKVENGEVYIALNEPKSGKLSLNELGFVTDTYKLKGGFLRIVFDFEGVGAHEYYKVPTIEMTYDREVPNTHWICEFNGETLIDKVDHFGHSTIILLDRNRLSKLEQHHENKLILHAEFPQEASLLTRSSFVNFFK